MTPNINWPLIAKLPADGEIYPGSPELGAFRVRHLPATLKRCEMILAETSDGLNRRMATFRKGRPATWGRQELISGSIAD